MTTAGLQLEPNRPNWVAGVASALWQPSVVCLPFLVIGFVLWLGPSMQGAAGFLVREELSFGSVMILVAWYSCICFCAAMGQHLAKSLPRLEIMSADALDAKPFYGLLTVLATIGVVAAYVAALRNGVSMFELIQTQQFNLVKESLYDNYNHLYSLRYAASLTGGYALYRLVFLGKFSLIDAFNFALLLAAAAMSARIQIAQAVIIAGGLAIRFDAIRRVSMRAIVLTAVGLSVCMVAFTWVRSAGSYREYFGVANPVTMTYLEFQRYLGAPVQASVGVARIAANQPSRGSTSNIVKYVTPTFLHPESLKVSDSSGGVGEQWYLHQVDVDESLTTNSAFVEMYGDLGFWAFPTMAWVSFLMAAIGSYFWRADNLLCLVGCIVLYAFFELWRTYYFAAGSFTFLILAVMVAAVGVLLLKHFGSTE